MTDSGFYEAPHEENPAIAKGGVACPFPWRLHEMLKVTEEEGLQRIVSWCSHGRAFLVHQPKEFAASVMPRFFSQTKYTSFQRQLNMYGFTRLVHAPDKGAYYSLCFLRGHPALVRHMVRHKIKGTKVRKSPVEEPNFYDTAWDAHVEATIPASLQTTRAVSPAEDAKLAVPVVAPVTLSAVSRFLASGTRSTVSDCEGFSCQIGGMESLVDVLETLLEPKVAMAWQHVPVYENPFEPTPIRETSRVYHPSSFF